MTRLADDIALLERVADICGKVIYCDDPRVTVPDGTLRALAGEVEAARLRVAEYPLIGDEAAFLVKAAQHVAWARLEDDAALGARWQRLGELLRAAVEVDLVNARKSAGV